jgi:hypothetical protein
LTSWIKRSRALRRRRLGLAIVAGAVGLGVAVAQAASEPTVHLYDVTVSGALRTTFSLPAKPLPLDLAWSETSTWKETYPGVRLELQTSEFGSEQITMKLAGKGTITGSMKYVVSGPRLKTCGWSTTKSESAALRLWGTPYSTGATTYRLDLETGRPRTGRQPLRPPSCQYFEGKSATIIGLPVGPGGVVDGSIDTRAVRLTAMFNTPQQTGQLSFPLNRLTAGAGFVLKLRAKTKAQAGRLVSEGTAQVAFVPR